jgi:predicted metalloprotease
MKLRRRADSGDIIDRRGDAPTRAGIGGMPIAAGGGIGTIVILVIVFILSNVMGGGGSGFNIGNPQFPGSVPSGGTDTVSSPSDEPGQFVEDVLADVQDYWTEAFSGSGKTYERAKLVLFSGATQSGCGAANSATGPFYCPADNRVYLDTEFFAQLHQQFGAPGDFAQAYVIAHEVGHHVQTLLGTNAAVQQESQKNPKKANELSVRLELQADCYAGAWGHSAQQRGILDAGDLEEALVAAAAIGDDRLQEQAGVDINQDTWTHGSSEQRTKWFKTGFDTGDPSKCDTFSGSY